MKQILKELKKFLMLKAEYYGVLQDDYSTLKNEYINNKYVGNKYEKQYLKTKIRKEEKQ